MYNREYIKELENFITDELLRAYIESKVRNGMNPNQSYIIKRLLVIMTEKKPIPALLKKKLT